MNAPTPGERPSIPADLDRYARQILFEPIGEEGQRRLAASRVLLVGCGALGTVLANTLVRAGVGFLRLCDRDFIERNNLQRQILFDEDDIAANLPKAEAAAAKLSRINPQVTIEPVVTDVNHRNIEALADGMALILDGTDNFETRFLINDLAVSSGRPWVYGAVIGATGLCMTVVPHDTPCLRCVFEEAPPPEMNPTCDTAGVIGPAVSLVASFQAVEAIKLLIGKVGQINRHLMHIDAWQGRVVNLDVQSAYAEGRCPCCHRKDYAFLRGDHAAQTTSLCGRDAVQISAGSSRQLDFAELARKLQAAAQGEVRFNRFLLKASLEGHEVTLFADGRAIIQGTSDPQRARNLYARYIGA